MVVVDVDGLSVVFPYPSLYPEQLSYMLHLKRALDSGGHALLEMPSGTGKTQTLLSFITAYLSNRTVDCRKFVYCTRTVEEIHKVLEEMKILLAARHQELAIPNDLLTVGLASRRHLCVHPTVSQMDSSAVDGGCRALTSSWVREAVRQGTPDAVAHCSFLETYDREGADAILRPGVYSLDDLRVYGLRKQWCPYFLARHSVSVANIVVYSYHYLLDPKVASIVSDSLPPESIIVFDEAHNIDNVCIEALSVDLEQSLITTAAQNVTQLNSILYREKKQATERFQTEYLRIVSGLPVAHANAQHVQPPPGRAVPLDDVPLAPVLPDDVLREAVPEPIRKAEEFVSFLEKLVAFLQTRVSTRHMYQERPPPFLRALLSSCDVFDSKVLRATYDRLISLLMTVQVSSWHKEFRPLLLVGDFVTLLSTYEKEGMAIIAEPYDDFTGEYKPVLRLACLDASLAIRWIMQKFRSVVITSGTLSPLDTYPRMLNFPVVVSASLNMSMERRCVCPMIMTKGADQVSLSSRYKDRQSVDIPRNYGHALLQLASSVPDGIVAFFVSYVFMQQIIDAWCSDGGILSEIRQQKLVFVETQDPIEASLAIQNYKAACDSGRGAILLSVARGRAAEGIDFDGHYGRAVIIFGVPFQYTESSVLKARLSFLFEKFQIHEEDFLVFDAMRQAAQCAGRVIRSKNDYGVVIFADKRFARAKLRSKLPRWIAQFLTSACLDMDIGTTMGHVRSFLLEMAQPTTAKARVETPEERELEFF